MRTDDNTVQKIINQAGVRVRLHLHVLQLIHQLAQL